MPPHHPLARARPPRAGHPPPRHPGRARRHPEYLLSSGETLDAPAALRTGLVEQLIAADELETAVGRFTDVLAARSALSQRATKEVLAALTQGDDGEAVVAPRYRETIASGGLAEGVLAFAERREPRFPWRH